MSSEIKMRGDNEKDINMMEEVNGKYEGKKQIENKKREGEREREIKDREQEGAK